MKKQLLFLALLGLFTLPVHAADDVSKTLPTAMYTQMKSGKKLEKVWMDPAYDRSKGFKIAPLAYKADLRISDVIDSLGKGLGTLGTADSVYTLKVAVVKVTTKTNVLYGNIMGAVTVEGQIIDTDGRVIACFVTKEKAADGGISGGKGDYTFACDKIASAIAKDLL